MIFMHVGSLPLDQALEDLTEGHDLITGVEQLLTPLDKRNRWTDTGWFCIDNGGFTNFNREGFTYLLAREHEHVEYCRFVAVPDVVASARRTLELFDDWRKYLTDWPLALVCQDGLEDLDIPWHYLNAVFIGGSTEWKMSHHARHIIRAAKARVENVWVHVGRVNGANRLRYFHDLGADSFDGTGLSLNKERRERMQASLSAPRLELGD